MKQSGQIRARRHVYAGKGLLHGAGATDSRAALKDQHSLVRTRQICRAGKAVVAGTDYNHIPTARGQSTDRCGQSNFAKDSGCG